MIILIECQQCFFTFKEDVDEPMEECPVCGYLDLLEVNKDWNQD